MLNLHYSANNLIAGFIQESEQSVFNKIKLKLIKKHSINGINNPDAITYGDIRIEIPYYSESATKLGWFMVDKNRMNTK